MPEDLSLIGLLCRNCSGLFDRALQLLAGMKGSHAPRLDGDHLAGFWIAPRTRGLVPNLKVSEAGQLDGRATCETFADFFKKGIDDVFGFPFIQPHPLEKQL